MDVPRRAQKEAPKRQQSCDRGGPEAAKPRRSRAVCAQWQLCTRRTAATGRCDLSRGQVAGGGRGLREPGERKLPMRPRERLVARNVMARSPRRGWHGRGGGWGGRWRISRSKSGRERARSGAMQERGAVFVTAAALWPRSMSAKVARRAQLLLELRHGQRHAAKCARGGAGEFDPFARLTIWQCEPAVGAGEV